MQVSQLEMDFAVMFVTQVEIEQTKAGEIGNEDIARQITLDDAIKIIGSLFEGAIQILVRTLVLD